MIKPAALYPFASEHLPFVKYFSRLQNKYTISSVISPRGLGLSGKDAGHSRNHHDIGITVQDNLSLDDSWDTLYVAEGIGTAYIPNVEKSMIDMAKQALLADKTIRYFPKHMGAIPSEYKELAEIYPGKVSWPIDHHIHEVDSDSRLHGEIDTPVILVGGLQANADTLEVLCSLAVRLRMDGLKPLVLTRNTIYELFGFHSYAHIFDDTTLLEAEKVTNLKVFAKNLELKEVPDIILVEAPGTVTRVSSLVPGDYGIQTYMLCQTMPPDYFIYCTHFGAQVGKSVDRFSETFLHTFGIPITAVHVSNMFIDDTDIHQKRIIGYTHVPLTTVSKQIEGFTSHTKIPIYNIVDDGIDELYQLLRDDA